MENEQKKMKFSFFFLSNYTTDKRQKLYIVTSKKQATYFKSQTSILLLQKINSPSIILKLEPWIKLLTDASKETINIPKVDPINTTHIVVQIHSDHNTFTHLPFKFR